MTAHPGYSGVIATHVLALVAPARLGLLQGARRRTSRCSCSRRWTPPASWPPASAPVAVNGGDYTFYQVKKKGNPVEIVYPEGRRAARGLADARSPSFAPHPNAAKLFTDFTFTREIQQVMADSEGLYTGHPDVKYPTDKPKLGDLKLLHGGSRGAREAQRGDQEALRGVLRRREPLMAEARRSRRPAPRGPRPRAAGLAARPRSPSSS